jgi:hypothetical protein
MIEPQSQSSNVAVGEGGLTIPEEFDWHDDNGKGAKDH